MIQDSKLDAALQAADQAGQGVIVGILTQMAAQVPARFTLTWGTSTSAPVLEEWNERCDLGCRCIPVSQMAYQDVKVRATEADVPAPSFASACVQASMMCWNLLDYVPQADVVMFTVASEDAQNILAVGWMPVAEARKMLTDRSYA